MSGFELNDNPVSELSCFRQFCIIFYFLLVSLGLEVSKSWQ
jgi:hypothetical protein